MNRADATPNFQPLYRQIKQLLTRSLADGVWQPGAAIPSEMALASGYQVSQGTVRKAIDELVQDNMLVRRQGKGTFVATHADAGTDYRFLRLRNLADEQVYPHSDFHSFGRCKADAHVAGRLGLRSGSALVRIERTLSLAGDVVVYDDIRLPARLLQGMSSALVEDHVNAHKGTLYSLYETRYRIRIVGAHERIRASLADAVSAPPLGVAPGTPLLCIERVAYTYKQQPVEWRMSYVNTAHHYYFDELN